MSGYTWRLIDWFQENRGASTTRLAINSNLGFEQDKLERLLDATEGIQLDLYTSNESIGRHAIYIRDGLDWDQWCDNVTYLLDSKRLRGLHVMCTINALCLLSLREFLFNIVNLKLKYGSDSVNFSLNILRFPSFQSVLVLPLLMREHYADELAFAYGIMADDVFCHEFELNQLSRLIEYLRTPEQDPQALQVLRHDFKNFYEQYDQRRGKDFRATFPQLTEWYDTL
jgi:hypothetical protein